ncbi:hypothetical protein ACFWYW_23690 [Nonomuraea sp. NPDC059023]|uniref:hypothetical protein n=1 Tax=unclassified Nonomuraea TaxID=2593643 RepID=UPI0036943AE0
MKIDLSFTVSVSEDSWAHRFGVDLLMCPWDVGYHLSDAIGWLPGISDTNARIHWRDSRPVASEPGRWVESFHMVIEVPAATWEAWAQIESGRARRDAIEYLTYSVAGVLLVDTDAVVAWQQPAGGDPIDMAQIVPKQRAELLFRWPIGRESE